MVRPLVERAILVIDEAPDLVAGLRSRLDPRRALLVRSDSTPGLDHFRPWPFAVIGASRPLPPRLSEALLATLARLPIPVVWLGPAPAGLPEHAVSVSRFAQLRDAVLALVAADCGGLRLADHRGLIWAGRTIHSPHLEGLVAGHDRTWVLPAAVQAAARRVIRLARLPVRLQRSPGSGVRLVEEPG